MIPVNEMRAAVLGAVDRMPACSMAVADACGFVVAVDVVSPNDYPLFDNSAMDGFAVRSCDLTSPGTTLDVVGVSSAGHPFGGVVGPGQAARILTGAQMVDGADCVVPVESAEVSSDCSDSSASGLVRVMSVPSAGDFVRPRAGIVAFGDSVILAGTRLNAGHLGLLTSLGVQDVEVVARPRVTLISTGDELVSPDVDRGPGQIFESNTVVVATLLHGLGCEVDMIHLPDDVDLLREHLRMAACDHEVIITIGGVSMGGEYDALRQAMGSFDVGVHQVAIKPAKPFAFGQVDGAVTFGLPGNPASVIVSFENFVRPALRRMSGMEPTGGETITGVTGAEIRRVADEKAHFLPMAQDSTGLWVVTQSLGSHAVSPYAEATAMLRVEIDQTEIPAGTAVELMPLWI